MYITNRQQFSMVCALIDHTDDFNMFQTQVEPRAAGEVVSWQSFEHFDVIFMVDKIKKQNYVH